MLMVHRFLQENGSNSTEIASKLLRLGIEHFDVVEFARESFMLNLAVVMRVGSLLC